MKAFILSLLLAFSLMSWSQDIVTFDQLSERWKNNNDTLYVINYWATWCSPCVEELPEFIKLDQEMKGQKFKMILVSLDFPKHIDSRVNPFLKNKNITTEVVILDDDANVWINLVYPDWDGDIPATQVIKNNKKEFHNKQLSYKELKQITSSF